MDWQVTATTIYCDWVNSLAVIMVYPDGTAKCSYFNRYEATKDKAKKLKDCKAPQCPKLSEFRDRAFSM